MAEEPTVPPPSVMELENGLREMALKVALAEITQGNLKRASQATGIYLSLGGK